MHSRPSNYRPASAGGAGHIPDREVLKREYPELEDEDFRQALACAAGMLDDRILPLPVYG